MDVSETETLQGPSADRPLTDPAGDRLGYAPFAKTLAQAIEAMKAPDGMVIGIHGQWGSGKTTILNFAEHYLVQTDAEFTIIRFNPWWFSGRANLAQMFFAQLQAAFMKWRALGNDVRERLAKFGRAVGTIPGLEVARAGAEVIDVDFDVPALKESISKALRDQEGRLLVMVDDIDRLTHQEIAQLFAVIKSLADFPNTIYLLAFDPDIVSKALEREFGENGEAYLEKIIQVPFELPPPSESSLRTLFLEQLSDIVGTVTDDDLLDLTEWSRAFDQGILPLLESPRDVVRLTNALRVTYAAVAGEVNVVDFVAVETVRIFAPAVYRHIRERPDMFGTQAGIAALLAAASQADRPAFHSQWVSVLPERTRTPIQLLIATMFPQAAPELPERPVQFGSNSARARRGRRIQDPEVYPIFFRLSLSPGDVSRAEVAALLEAQDVQSLKSGLTALSKELDARGTSKVRPMLDELIGQTDSIGAKQRSPLIRALLEVGDELCRPQDNDPFGLGNDDRIVVLASELIGKMDQSERLPVIDQGFKESNAVWIPVMLARQLVRELGIDQSTHNVDEAPNEGHAPLGLIDARVVEDAALTRIRNAGADGRLVTAPGLGQIMHAWTVWGSQDEVRAWVAQIQQDDEALAQLLMACLRVTIGPGGAESARLNPKWLDPYADLEGLTPHVERLRDRDDLAGQAARQYLAEYEAIQSGRDPDSRFDRG